MPKGFCKEKARLRFAKLRRDKQGQNLGKIEHQRENNFKEILLQLKSKNSEQTPERQLYRAYWQNNSDQKDDLVIYEDFFRQADKIYFWKACHNSCTFLESEAKLGTMLENKDTMMLLQ